MSLSISAGRVHISIWDQIMPQIMRINLNRSFAFQSTISQGKLRTFNRAKP